MSACAQAISCSVVEGFEGAFATDGVAEEDRQKVDHLVVPKTPPCKADALIDGRKDPLLAQLLDNKHSFPQPTGGVRGQTRKRSG